MNNSHLPNVERKPDCLFSKQQKPLVQMLHNRVRGRVRYKVRGLQGSEYLQQFLEFRLSSKPGIERIHASSWSGNILILFSKKLNSQVIASLITTIVEEYRQQPQQAIALMQNRSPTVSVIPNLLPLESWHLQETAEILTHLETSQESGLSWEKVQYNLQKYGTNILAKPPPRSGLSIFINYFREHL